MSSMARLAFARPGRAQDVVGPVHIPTVGAVRVLIKR